MNQLNDRISLVKDYFLNLQDLIFQAFVSEDDQAQRREDIWEHPQGGGGKTRVMTGGTVIEKGAVNFSHIHGRQLPPSASERHPELAGGQFQALGVSVVIHPLNPHAPTVHLNVRFFISQTPSGELIWWFGGGFDLTPYYGYREDARDWHQNARLACEPFGKDIYPQFKKACDDYFYLPHRQEPRGIGGLFFDDFKKWEFQRCFALTRHIGDHFLPGYLPILQRRKNTPYSTSQRDFQCYRRGRYVEFNLLYDRGTVFGLQSGGRTESILLSLPPQVHWHYQWRPEPGSPEEQLCREFLVVQDWIK